MWDGKIFLFIPDYGSWQGLEEGGVYDWGNIISCLNSHLQYYKS
jgi:hypothetical protein